MNINFELVKNGFSLSDINNWIEFERNVYVSILENYLYKLSNMSKKE